MESYVLPTVLVLAGTFFFIRNIIQLRNEEKLRRYLQTSPKAALWIKKLGVEKTVSLSKKVFLPIGCIISLVMVGIGVWSLLSLSAA